MCMCCCAFCISACRAVGQGLSNCSGRRTDRSKDQQLMGGAAVGTTLIAVRHNTNALDGSIEVPGWMQHLAPALTQLPVVNDAPHVCGLTEQALRRQAIN